MGNVLFCSPQKETLESRPLSAFVLSSTQNVILDGLCKKNKGLHTYGNAAVNKLTTIYSAS